MLNEQTHRKAEEFLEFRLTKSRETFHFKSPITIEGFWMIGLISLEIYNSFVESSFGELNDELEEIFNISDI